MPTTGKPQTQQKNSEPPNVDAMGLEEYLTYMRNRTPEQIAAVRAAMYGSHTPRPLPPGKTLEDVFVGALPDDLTDEEVEAALEEIE